jgi:hypothetical protein
MRAKRVILKTKGRRTSFEEPNRLNIFFHIIKNMSYFSNKTEVMRLSLFTES